MFDDKGEKVSLPTSSVSYKTGARQQESYDSMHTIGTVSVYQVLSRCCSTLLVDS